MQSTDGKTETLSPGKLPGALLGRLIGALGSPDPAVIVGPGVGRDAAAIDLGGEILVLKSDPITFASDGAPAYLVNVNANDLACLGATPRWMLVTALLPTSATEEMVERLFHDLAEATREAGITLVGGHTEITPGIDRPILVGMLSGTAPRGRYLAPGGARPGDLLLLSKPIAIEGTSLLASELADLLTERIGAELVARSQRLLHQPGISVLADAEVALASGAVHALHDPTEGGLAMGAREIAEASRLGVELDLATIPVFEETQAVAGALGLDPLGMLASGSLLIAADPARAGGVITALESSGQSPAIVGRLTEERGAAWLIDQDERRPLPVYVRDEVSRALTGSPAPAYNHRGQ